MISFLHSGAGGDVIASLSTIKEICDRKNEKAKIVLDPTGGTTANDPALNKLILAQTKGRGYNFRRGNCEFIKPLIESQQYVQTVEIWDGSSTPVVDFNLNRMRFAMQDSQILRQTNQNIEFLYQAAFGLAQKYNGPWLQAPKIQVSKPVCIARSTRYQSAQLFFAMHEDKLRDQSMFVGTEFEYAVFQNSCSFSPSYMKTRDALEAASVINSSDTFIANGTLLYWIGVGLGHPRIIHELAVDIPTTYYPRSRNITFVQGGHAVK